MIRINLLPVRQARRRQFGRVQVFLGLIVIVIEVLALFLMWQGKRDERDSVQAVVAQKQQEIAERQQTNEQIQQLEGQLQELMAMSQVISDLESRRSGPAGLMDELKLMLNRPANDLERSRQDLRGWDTNWDPTQLWLNGFSESAGELDLTGGAASPTDIAEFYFRLASSGYVETSQFDAVNATDSGRVQAGGEWSGQQYEWHVRARISYSFLVDQR